ncbi:MAG: hypothetical protein AAF847_16670 [Bacteroidota bacterium]
MKTSLTNLLIVGVAAEIIIFLLSYFLQDTTPDTFRLAARYSGRLSALVFLYTFFLYARSHPKPLADNIQVRQFIQLFAILHLIHFGFLAMSVYLNAIPLETVKVIGGALAYSMIVLAPFLLHKVKPWGQMVYFYYVSLVMILTYVARIKGEFEGAATTWVHFAVFGTLLIAAVVFGVQIRRNVKYS